MRISRKRNCYGFNRARTDREFFALSPKQAINLVSRLTTPYACEDTIPEPLSLASELPVIQPRSPVQPRRTSTAYRQPETSSRGDGLVTASTLSGAELAPNSSTLVQSQVAELASIILEVCPQCQVKRRGDGALIFVPPERCGSSTQKNLITVWPTVSTIKIRIMPDPMEKFVPEKLPTYKSRLNSLYINMLDLEK